MDPTKQAFQVYHDTAKEQGYESGPQNLGYLWKVHVDETEELEIMSLEPEKEN